MTLRRIDAIEKSGFGSFDFTYVTLPPKAGRQDDSLCFNNMSQEIEFTDQNFEQEVLKANVPVLVDFWAPWCGPCQMMGPILKELAEAIGDKANVGKLNVDENPATSSQYEIMSIPAIKIFKGGVVVKEFVGVQIAEVLKKALEELA